MGLPPDPAPDDPAYTSFPPSHRIQHHHYHHHHHPQPPLQQHAQQAPAALVPAPLPYDSAAFCRHLVKCIGLPVRDAHHLDADVEKALAALANFNSPDQLLQFLHYMKPLIVSLPAQHHNAFLASFSAYSPPPDKSAHLWNPHAVPRRLPHQRYFKPDPPEVHSFAPFPACDASPIHLSAAGDDSAISDASVGSSKNADAMIHIMRPEERNPWAYQRFIYIQQCPIKELAVKIIQEIDPKKQNLYPYKKIRTDGATGPRPPYWPDDPDVRHDQSPSHLRKDERVKLLVHFLFLPANNFEFYQEWKQGAQGQKHGTWYTMLKYAVSCSTLKGDGPKLRKHGANPAENMPNRIVDRAHIASECSEKEREAIAAREEVLDHMLAAAYHVEHGVVHGAYGLDDLVTLSGLPALYASKEKKGRARARKRKHPSAKEAYGLADTDKGESDSEDDDEDDGERASDDRRSPSPTEAAEDDDVVHFTDEDFSVPSTPAALASSQTSLKKRKAEMLSPRMAQRTGATSGRKALFRPCGSHPPPPPPPSIVPPPGLNSGFATEPPTYMAYSQTDAYLPASEATSFSSIGYHPPMLPFAPENDYIISPGTPDRRLSLQSPMAPSTASGYLPQPPGNSPMKAPPPEQPQQHDAMQLAAHYYHPDTFYPSDGASEMQPMQYTYYDRGIQHPG